ncbi:helix-turn-helix transcriptional regulator [Paenibacillus sp. IHBB 3054]|uniref:helix-turn-helix transcriptional regulator n=1 Tax=Paenibacillus sp. IHBB 3054 TaxID=3425689 RepID=UPI003F66A827
MKREWLLQKRVSLGKTQESVAEGASIARTTYASYEQGERTPSVPAAKRIGEILKFDWTIFFEH